VRDAVGKEIPIWRKSNRAEGVDGNEGGHSINADSTSRKVVRRGKRPLVSNSSKGGNAGKSQSTKGSPLFKRKSLNLFALDLCSVDSFVRRNEIAYKER